MKAFAFSVLKKDVSKAILILERYDFEINCRKKTEERYFYWVSGVNAQKGKMIAELDALN